MNRKLVGTPKVWVMPLAGLDSRSRQVCGSNWRITVIGAPRWKHGIAYRQMPPMWNWGR